MPKTKAPRKKYRPKHVLRDPVGYATEGVGALVDHDTYVCDWKMAIHLSMSLVMRGSASESDGTTLMACVNVVYGFIKSMVPVELPAHQEYLGIWEEARKSLNNMFLRNRLVGTGPEITALNNVISLHDEFLDNITVKQMEDAIKYAKKGPPL